MDDQPPPPYSLDHPGRTLASSDPSLNPADSSPSNPSFDAHYSSPPEEAGLELSDEKAKESKLKLSSHPYFNMYPPPVRKPLSILHHRMIFSQNLKIENLSFPQPGQKWLKRNLGRSDWIAFLNHLIPQDIDDSRVRPRNGTAGVSRSFYKKLFKGRSYQSPEKPSSATLEGFET